MNASDKRQVKRVERLFANAINAMEEFEKNVQAFKAEETEEFPWEGLQHDLEDIQADIGIIASLVKNSALERQGFPANPSSSH